ncbi:MAG: 16S rRNA (guanine(527)-N(7))-methyltransferase RsmG [Lachnospiraceae bacterium]|nr:16S rRNA (guanine(527)-N(7))-methyltransferase RsmG [Lachnospiraceae bacterium]
MRDNSILVKGAEQMGIVLSDKQQQQFETYYDYLVAQNEVMNLTAITEYKEVLTKHFLDSLFLAQSLKEFAGKKVLDLGTGAGFPGIPLKIAFPETEFVLMDSLNKRIGFLNRVIDLLDLKKITAVHARAEEAARKSEYREQFDYCVSRAVARLATLSEFCIPFVKPGGSFISYKAGDCREECEEAKNAIKILGGKLISAKEMFLPDTEIARTFVMIRKEKHTPEKYPRGQGKPLKQPL